MTHKVELQSRIKKKKTHKVKKTKIVQQGKTTRRRHICAFFIFTIHFCYSFYSKFNTDYLADAMENGSTALRQSWEGAAVSNRAYGRAWSGKQTMTNNNISTLSLTLHTHAAQIKGILYFLVFANHVLLNFQVW